MKDDEMGTKGGVVFEILPGGKKGEPGDMAHDAGVKAVTSLLQDLIAKQENDAEALNRAIVIMHSKNGLTFRMAGPLSNGGLSFYDAMALLGITQAMMHKLMAGMGVI